MAVNKTKQGQQEVQATWQGIVEHLERELRLPAYRIAERGQSIPALAHVLSMARALACPRSARLWIRPNGAVDFHPAARASTGNPWGGGHQRAQRLKDAPLEQG